MVQFSVSSPDSDLNKNEQETFIPRTVLFLNKDICLKQVVQQIIGAASTRSDEN